MAKPKVPLDKEAAKKFCGEGVLNQYFKTMPKTKPTKKAGGQGKGVSDSDAARINLGPNHLQPR